MKLDNRRTEAFLDNPGSIRAALIFGDDQTLARSRVRRLVQTITGAADDPFRSIQLDRGTLGSLPAELASRPLTGGRRVVRVSDVSDSQSAALVGVLSKPWEAFLVVEAGSLKPKSKLRMGFESAADAACVPCQGLDAADAGKLFASALSSRSVTLGPDERAWAESRLGHDRASVEAEAERLMVFLHPRQVASLADLRECLEEGAEVPLDDAIFAAMAGSMDELDRALATAFEQGANPVSMITATIGHLTRLQRCGALIQSGMRPADAMGTLYPPVYFKRRAAFLATLEKWSAARIGRAGALCASVELACKQTGSPAELLVRNAFYRLASAAPSRLSR